MCDNQDLISLFQETGRFSFVRQIDGFVFIAEPICDLTAFCSPSQRVIRGRTRIDFDYGLTVIPSDCESSAFRLQENLREGRYVALPKTVPSRHSLDMIVSEKGISTWLLREISRLLERYSLSSTEALEIINRGDDKLIAQLRSVYREKFELLILKPLSDIRRCQS